MSPDASLRPFFYYLRDESARWTGGSVESYVRTWREDSHFVIRFNANTFETLSKSVFLGEDSMRRAITRLHNHFYLDDAIPPERLKLITTQNKPEGVLIHYETKERTS